MNILQINTSDKGGGAEGSAFNLFKEYKRRGHKSWMAVGKKKTSERNVFQIPNSYKNGFERYIKTFTNPAKFSNWFNGIEDFDIEGTHKILDIIPNPPDIVHCHNLHGYYFDLRELPAISKATPLILNLRDAWLLTGHCSYYFDCMRWQADCESCPYLSTYPAIRKDSSAYNWQRKKEIYSKTNAYIVTNSKWLMHCVDQSMLRGKKHRVIYNGIDLNIFKPGDKSISRRILGLPENSSIIMFAANRAQKNIFKDYDTVLKVIELLSSQKPVDNIVFLCVGADKKQIVDGKYYYEPFISDQRVLAEYYRAADVFIHAAHAEAFGKTITESMACGTPVVATAIGGISEQIEDGISGFLVPHMDYVQMFNKTVEILKRNELRDQFISESLKKVSYFSIKRQAEEFLSYYEEVLEEVKGEK